MVEISDKVFDKLVGEAIDSIPEQYLKRLDNVAFIVEDFPNQAQRSKLNLHPNELLFGLYEGAPLPMRNGATKLLPDKITLFKKTLEMVSNTKAELKEHIRHTIWHEVAHYYGLDHERIHELENKNRG